jgi:hypothetical protein
MREGVRRFTG